MTIVARTRCNKCRTFTGIYRAKDGRITRCDGGYHKPVPPRDTHQEADTTTSTPAELERVR